MVLEGGFLGALWNFAQGENATLASPLAPAQKCKNVDQDASKPTRKLKKPQIYSLKYPSLTMASKGTKHLYSRLMVSKWGVGGSS